MPCSAARDYGRQPCRGGGCRGQLQGRAQEAAEAGAQPGGPGLAGPLRAAAAQPREDAGLRLDFCTHCYPGIRHSTHRAKQLALYIGHLACCACERIPLCPKQVIGAALGAALSTLYAASASSERSMPLAGPDAQHGAEHCPASRQQQVRSSRHLETPRRRSSLAGRRRAGARPDAVSGERRPAAARHRQQAAEAHWVGASAVSRKAADDAA